MIGWIFLAIAVGLVVWLVAGVRIVQQQERFLIEFFGRFLTVYGPGFRLILPGVITVRAAVNVWEMRIPLYEQPIKIDFKDGSATPKGAEAFVKVKSPDQPYQDVNGESATGVFRAIYFIGNWKAAIKDLLENAIRSYLNSLTIDKGLVQAAGGYDLTENRLPQDEIDRINDTLACWGFELTRVTIQDFDLSPELVAAREEVQKRRREVDVAQFEQRIRSIETMGSFIRNIALSTGLPLAQVKGRILGDDELLKRVWGFSEDLVTQRMSIDGKALTDIRVSGGGDFTNTVLQMIAAFKSKLGQQQAGGIK